MKRATTMLLTMTAAVLLGGCVADFDDDHRHGRHYDRDHGRYHDHDQRWDDRRDGRRYYRDRDDD